MLEVMSAALLLSGLSNLNAIALQKDLSFRRLFRLQQAVAVTDLVVTVSLAIWLRDVWALVLGQIIKSVVALILSYVLIPGNHGSGGMARSPGAAGLWSIHHGCDCRRVRDDRDR